MGSASHTSAIIGPHPAFTLIAILDVDGTLTAVSLCAVEASQQEHGDILGKLLWDGPWWAGTETCEHIRRAVSRVAVGEVLRLQCQVQIGHLGRPPASAELCLFPVKDGSGRVIRLLAEVGGTHQGLLQSSGCFQQIAENVSDVLYITDSTRSRLFYVNPAYERLFGCRADELHRNPAALHEPVHPSDRDQLTAMFATKAATSYQIEYRIQLPGGESRWLLERGFPLREPGNQAECQIGIISDVTVSREAREKLRRLNENLEQRIAERTERLRMMIESSAEAVITMDSEGFIEEWNRAAERIFGWNRTEAVGRRLSDLIIPERYRAAHEAGMRRFLTSGTSRVLNETIELSALRRSGEEFPIELSVWPVRCAEGFLFSAFLRDITDRKRAMAAEKQRSEQALLFRTVLYELARMDRSDYADSMRHILRTAAQTLGLARVMFARFETLAAGVVLQAEAVYRSTSDDFMPQAELGAFPMADYPQYFAALVSNRPVIANDACSDPATIEFRDHYLLPHGITSMLDVPVWMGGQVVAVVCHEHIGPARNWSAEEVGFALSIGNMAALTLEAANRARTEQELREAEADVRMALAREQELNELKSRFVSMASHEFRTPLTAILSSAEMLERYGERLDAENKSDLIGMIKLAVKNMTQMLEEVLFIGRADTGHLHFNPQATDPDAFCKLLLKELKAGLGKHHRLEFTPSGDRTLAYLDVNLLRQILVNLLSNAIKFSPQGSSVTLHSARDGRAITFEVTDHGIGIPPEDRPSLFSTFHRARNVTNIPGTGLGLAIVKQCVDLHGGEMSYSSTLGEGTRFLVKIPLTGEPA